MSEKTAENEADTSSFKIDMKDLDFSLCALGVVGEVDPFDAQMGKSLELTFLKRKQMCSILLK